VLVLPVDPEQLGVLAADAQDERLAVHDDLEVVVGDPAAQRLDGGRAARPQSLDHSARLHRAILGGFGGTSLARGHSRCLVKPS